MADNYLEQRMEDMRSGKLHKTTISSASLQNKKTCHFSFPERKVLILGDYSEMMISVIRAFQKTGSKVAVMMPDLLNGKKIASEEGVRFYPVEINDVECGEHSLTNLLTSWRNVDIIISCLSAYDSIMPAIISTWITHKNNFPYNSAYGGRLIIIGNSTASLSTTEEKELGNLGITVNSIKISSFPLRPDSLPVVGRLCLIVSLPDSSFINHLEITHPFL
ncbi:MAG: hypothetical protein K2J82_12615 [Muribaculaceae bacterium]|nr:hypothetical protein [Muribaculaceae bacterium]